MTFYYLPEVNHYITSHDITIKLWDIQDNIINDVNRQRDNSGNINIFSSLNALSLNGGTGTGVEPKKMRP